jgi:hypothetical protein
MRRISVPLYAPILVMVIVVVLVNVGGVAVSRDSGNRGENDLTPVRVANQFIPAGTPVEHLLKHMTPTSIPIVQVRQRRTISAVLRGPEPVPAPKGAQRLSGVVTRVNIYPGQVFMEEYCHGCAPLR